LSIQQTFPALHREYFLNSSLHGLTPRWFIDRHRHVKETRLHV